MPPKTRGSKTLTASKENIGVNRKRKTKQCSKVTKTPRKVLADKTNSASDDNASFLQSKSSNDVVRDNLLVKENERPRRERRPPSRYIENNGIENMSKSKNTSGDSKSNTKLTPVKRVPIVVLSPMKIPKPILDSSLTARKPKRICRLPSKFDDHSISPSKYIPVQPAYASTPKVQSKPVKQQIEKKDLNKKMNPTTTEKIILTKARNKRTENKKINDTSKSNSSNSSADTNNNAKTDQLPLSKTKNKQNTPTKSSVNNTKATVSKKLIDKNFSTRILENKKKSLKRDASNFDVYEFTYDPNEEPPPQKKKRKKPTKKREPKPKKVVFKDNYNKNLAKALTTLKSTITENSAKPVVNSNNRKVLVTQTCTAHPATDTVVTTVNTNPVPSSPCNANNSVKNYNSIRVEDIVLDFDQDSCVNDINYSPVHSYFRPTTPATQNIISNPPRPIPDTEALNVQDILNNVPNKEKLPSNNDPLNLRDDLSFFDEQPVASSSMNVSTRNPEASPWRVEFGSLPIKWQVNTYVKPNMTPAFECSFMNFNDSKKKHVYTNIVPDTPEENDLPQVYNDYASKLKQTSIISFIKEVVEKKEKKKKAKMTPIKANSLFEDPNDNSACDSATLAPNDQTTPRKIAPVNIQANVLDTLPGQDVGNISNENKVTPNNSKDNEKENTKERAKNSSKKKRDKNVTYFGFDDSENHDQENVSPVKHIDKGKLRALKPRARAVLQEINEQKGPTRAVLPVAVKSKPNQSSEAADKLFDQMKSATEPPVFPDENALQSTETTNITEAQNNADLSDDQSVHLFEDLEVVHHLKAQRKSYGKAKKAVTFRQNSISDSDVPSSDVAEQSASSDEDDLHDLTFKIPEVEPKKTTKKKKSRKPKISKKEEKEVEAWAAGFNSMCEDIEEFDLVVE